MTIEAEFTKLRQDSPLVTLVEIDATSLGGTIYRGSNDAPKGSNLVFGGVSYGGIPIEISGLDTNLNEASGRPTLTVSNVMKTLQGTVIALKGFAGATVTIKKTYAKFLDGASHEDPSQFVEYRYLIRSVTSMTNTTIVFELSSFLDQLNTMLPKEQMTRDRFPGLGRQKGLY